MARAIVATKQFDRSIKAAAASSTAAIGGISRTAEGLGLITGTAGAAALKMAIDFESAFTGVLKTVEGTDVQLDKLRTGILDMSEALPATANEIAGVAEQAGQLGIETNSVLGFTKVMIDMGESTNLSANDAAQSLARFFNIMGTGASKFDNLGSSIVDLGNNFATTESEITDISLRLAGAGKIVGLAESDILGLSTAMSSIGIAAERGGTAMTRTLVEINTAVDGGGERLQKFADVAGTTATAFAATWKDEPIDAVLEFIEGIKRLGEEGGNVSTTLDDLDLRGIRVQQTLTGLASAGNLTADAVERSATAWEQNTALATEAGRRYATTESQLRQFGNTLKRELIDTGTERLPVLLALLEENAEELPKILGDLADAGLNLFEALSSGVPLLEALLIIVSKMPSELVAFGISIGFVSRFSRALVGPLNAVLLGMSRLPAVATASRLGLGSMSAAAHGATTSMRTAASSKAATDAALGVSSAGIAGTAAANAEIRRALNVPFAADTGQTGPLTKTANQTKTAAGSIVNSTGRARVSFGALTAGMVVGAIALSEVNAGMRENARQTRQAEAAHKDYSRAVAAVLSEGESPFQGVGPAFDFEGFPDQESTLDPSLNVFKEYGELLTAVGGDFTITTDLIDKAGLSMRQLSREAVTSADGFTQVGDIARSESGNLGNLDWLENVFFWMDDDQVDNYTEAWEDLGVTLREDAIAGLDELVLAGTLTDGALALMAQGAGEVINKWSEFGTTFSDLAPQYVKFVDTVSSGISELGLDPRLGRTLSTLNIDLETGKINSDGFLRSVSQLSGVEGIESFGLSDAGFEALEAAVASQRFGPDLAQARRDALALLAEAATAPDFTILDFQEGLEAIGTSAGPAALGVERWNEEVTTARELAAAPPISPNIDAEATRDVMLDMASSSEIAEAAIAEAEQSMAGMGYTGLQVADILTTMNDANEDMGRSAFAARSEMDQQFIAAALLGDSMDYTAQVANDLNIEEQDLVDITAALNEEFAGLAESLWSAVPGMESAIGFMRERLQEQYDAMSDEFQEGTTFGEFEIDKTSLASYSQGLADVQSGQAEAFQFASDIDFLGADARTDDLAKALARLAETDAAAAIKLAAEARRIGPAAAEKFEVVVEEIDAANAIIQTVVEKAALQVTETDNRVRRGIERGTVETVDAMVAKYGEGARAIIESMRLIEEASKPPEIDTLEGRSVQNVFTALDFTPAELAADLELTANPTVSFDNLRTGEGAQQVQALLEAAGFVDAQIRAVMELDDTAFAATISRALVDVGALTDEQHLAVITPILAEGDQEEIDALFLKVSEMTRNKKVDLEYEIAFSYGRGGSGVPSFEESFGRNQTEVPKTAIGRANALPFLQNSSVARLKNLQDTQRLAEELPEVAQRALLEAKGFTDENIEAIIGGDAYPLELELADATDKLIDFKNEGGVEVPIGVETDGIGAALAGLAAGFNTWAIQNPIEIPVKPVFVGSPFTSNEQRYAEILAAQNAGLKWVAPAEGGMVDYYAKGGMSDAPHRAQIAPAGAWRVWAEPETGGEAYIPMGMNKRGRSQGILAEVARRFGYGLVSAADDEERKRRHVRRFADGGLINGPMRPASSNVSSDNRTTVRNEYNVSQPVNFQGDMTFTDPRQTVEYAQRRRRTNALVGIA